MWPCRALVTAAVTQGTDRAAAVQMAAVQVAAAAAQGVYRGDGGWCRRLQ